MDVSVILLVAAVVCFVLAAASAAKRAVPIGLACFAGSFLVDALKL